MYNSKYYYQYITDAYTQSEKNYERIFEMPTMVENFLNYYESMNVYPTYPRAIIMPLKKITDKKSNLVEIDTHEMEKYNALIFKKIKEYESHLKEMNKLNQQQKVRRYFDYEIRDKLNMILNTTNITNGWVKMSEILATYPMLLNNNTGNFETFHLCEHPGKFIFAIKDYIKKNCQAKHKSICQSLNPSVISSGFKIDPKLKNDISTIIDYGKTETGDITNAENIKYYIDTYKNTKFNLFTSDCGEDFSTNRTEQEKGLYKIYLSAFIITIGISKPGSSYVFKFFSFSEPKTIELLYFATLFYEHVDIVRLMTTKGNSGENYCICRNFIGDQNNIFDKLINYVNNDNDILLFNMLPEKFLSRIKKYHILVVLRRITILNNMMFRFFNNNFISENKIIAENIKLYVDYYTNYFIKYIGYK